jgi:hypothetical protein
MITDMLTGYDAEGANKALQSELAKEIAKLTALILETAKSNVRYYPEVRNHLEMKLIEITNEIISGEVTADYWQSWLEQFGKGSLMADSTQNPGLIKYMNSDAWNKIRSKGSKVVVGRGRGNYSSIDGTMRYSGGGYAGIDLEELAARGDIDKKFGPTPPTYFLRVALLSNRNRILQGIANVIADFPYFKYFKKG